MNSAQSRIPNQRRKNGIAAREFALPARETYSKDILRPRESEPITVDRVHSVDGRLAYGSLFTPLSSDDYRIQTQCLFESLRSAKSFLDIGCGFGNMLCLAREVNPNLDVAGIEIQKEPANAAAEYGKVIRTNALKYKGYAKFDVLYMYRPFVGYRDQLELEDVVIKGMRRGATLISLMPNHHQLCRNGQRGIYIKEEN